MSVRVVIPMGGLGNRLRVILSYRAMYGEIVVRWARSTGVCRGSFLDVFEPLSGVTFEDAGDGLAQDIVAKEGEIGPVSSASFSAPPSWPVQYMLLRPRAEILARVDELRAVIGPYVAIHARHSDHDENAARFGHVTTNDELLSWFHPHGGPLWLASECKRTIEWFRARVPRVYTNHDWGHQVVHYDERPGTLADAVVDMWMCLGATAFRGTYMSSFSETISLMRRGGCTDFSAIRDMPSTDAEHYRNNPQRAQAWIASQP